jgi:hypothetical protein
LYEYVILIIDQGRGPKTRKTAPQGRQGIGERNEKSYLNKHLSGSKGGKKMRIINGTKFYARDINAAIVVAEDTHYNGRNYQWYTIKYHQPSGYCVVIAQNSGDCFGDYGNRYYDCPENMYKGEGGMYPGDGWDVDDYAGMVGKIDEEADDIAIKVDFMARILKGAGKELKDCPKSRELLGLN